MEGEEYMKVPYKHFPPDIQQRYNLDKKVTVNGYIFIKIKKGVCGLRQAAILAYNNLKNHLEKHGYTPVDSTVGCGSTKQDVQNFASALTTSV